MTRERLLGRDRRYVTRGQPFGSEAWRTKVARKLDLEHTFRPRKKPPDNIVKIPGCELVRLPFRRSFPAVIRVSKLFADPSNESPAHYSRQDRTCNKDANIRPGIHGKVRWVSEV